MSVFRFKYFDVRQEKNPLKVGTDSMLLGAFIDASGKQYALDLGAGTGVLSLMLAQKNQEIAIDAIELDEFGADEAYFNFQNSPWANRIKAIQGSYFEYQFQKKYDLIFSNPPYHLNSLKSFETNVTTAKHTSHEEVILFFKLIQELLSDNGHFWIIVPFVSHQQFISLAADNLLYPAEITILHSKPDKPNVRSVICFSKNESKPIMEEFTIRDENGIYTREYQTLTKEFHWEKFAS